MIQWMNINVITLVAIMHENKEISILYTQSVLTDCLSLPLISNECRMSFIHQCLIFDSHPAELIPQFCYLLFRSECLYAMYVYKFDLMLHTLHQHQKNKALQFKRHFLFIFFLFDSI